MVMADFADYRRAQNDLSGLQYRDRGVWNRMSLMNIANAGIFFFSRPGGERLRPRYLARKAHQIDPPAASVRAFPPGCLRTRPAPAK